MRGGKQSPSKLSGVPTVCVLALGDVGRKTIRFKILTEKKTHLQTSTFNSLKKNLNLGAAIYYFHHISLSKQQLLFASLITLE